MACVNRFYSSDLYIRAASVVSTEVVSEMAITQGMGPLATLACGRVVTGALLMASVLKERQIVGLHFKGDGVLGSVYAEASFEGEARAWCDNPQAILPLNGSFLDVAGGIGAGVLNVLRSQPFEKSPHISTVQIQSGEVGDDIAYYLHQSLQIPCIIGLGGSLSKDGQELTAGGVMIELMPGAPESIITNLEDQAKKAKPLNDLLRGGADAEDLLANFVGGISMNMVPHDFHIKYACRCSVDRVERSLTLIGMEALDELISEEKPTEVRCEFCGKNYALSKDRLRQMVKEMSIKH
jgi:molecular chaperone Hsp33